MDTETPEHPTGRFANLTAAAAALGSGLTPVADFNVAVPRFEIVRSDAAQPWHARWIYANGEIGWTTEPYTRSAAAMAGVLAFSEPVPDGEWPWPFAVTTLHDGVVEVRWVDER